MGEINPSMNAILIDLEIYQSKKCIIFISSLSMREAWNCQSNSIKSNFSSLSYISVILSSFYFSTELMRPEWPLARKARIAPDRMWTVFCDWSLPDRAIWTNHRSVFRSRDLYRPITDQAFHPTVWVNIKPSLPTQIYQEMNTLHSKTVPRQTHNFLINWGTLLRRNTFNLSYSFCPWDGK